MRVAIGAGSNVGDPLANIRLAASRLENAGLKNLALSPFYGTKPVDCVPGTPDFVNAAMVGSWPSSIDKLLATCKAIEEAIGRPRVHASNEARVIDLDILLVEDFVRATAKLKIPHPQLCSRLFVLVPLRDLAPDWVIPPGKTTVSMATEKLLAETGDPLPIWRL